ncbi:hypothetical protein L1987_47727 [Smallanthus sonchifolius]|uniref:Uncharacterized protein n=1 Tax=Smallanthus sonchifolius TaxID=185202 RepID=A0ACB9G2R9_9ASTR|nr:hypothetical protein L1987_47727 [Smallanthus sonchifolius]
MNQAFKESRWREAVSREKPLLQHCCREACLTLHQGVPCGQRIVAGRIVKEIYGAAKQQHTFTMERREARLHEKEMKKALRESRYIIYFRMEKGAAT